MQAEVEVISMCVWESLVLLLAITLLGIASFYGVRPFLEKAGCASYSAYLGSLSVVFLVMLLWTWARYLAEGQPRTLGAFVLRTRLHRMNPKDLAWGFGLGLFMFLSTAAFSPLLSRAVSAGLLPLPTEIPDYLNPTQQQSLALLKGQFIADGILPLVPIVLVLNILAEELFWRGMVLPRQELRHGRGTVLVHGVIWALSHLFQYWLLPPILIGSVALTCVVQRTKNTSVSMLAHLLNNSFLFIVMLFIPAWLRMPLGKGPRAIRYVLEMRGRSQDLGRIGDEVGRREVIAGDDALTAVRQRLRASIRPPSG